MPSIALLTDFGREDHYVGVLHSVLERDAPGVARIDLGHGVPAGDIWNACFQLQCAWPHLPPDCVVVAVVDPGVGTSRRVVAVRVGERVLVAPDNGLAAAVGPADDVVVLDWQMIGLKEPSSTFHGRDLFAPAAARLTGDCAISGLGEPTEVNTLMACPLPHPRALENGVKGVILAVDRFGNLVTNVARGDGPSLSEALWRRDRRARRVSTYAEGKPEEVVLIEGSAGFFELAVNCGSAAEATGLERGDTVVFKTGGET